LSNTSAYTEILRSSMDIQYLGYWGFVISRFDQVYGFSLPSFNMSFNMLPTELYDASNVSIINGEFITWYSTEDSANDASIMIWNSTNVLLVGNEIISSGIGLLVYNPPYQTGKITISKNEFFGLNDLVFYQNNNSINQELAFDSSFDNGISQYGLQMYSGGNLIYGNFFITQTPAFSPEYNFYEGTPALYSDHWNNTTTGNAYWNYNLVHPFNESGLIASGYDYFPDSFITGANVTFTTGLNYNANISIAIHGMIASGVNSITFYKLFEIGTVCSYYAVYGDPITGKANFTVTSYNTAVNLSKVTLVNSLTFYAVGLPTGTTWSVTLGTQTISTTGESITFNEPDGQYSYNISTTNPSFIAEPSSGAINYSEPSSIYVTFVEVYNVTFTETGLPSGTAWYVNITGMPSSGPITSSSYTVSLMNGSYNFSVSSANKAFLPTYTSSFTVNGAPVSITVTFSKVLYKVTFTETGLPSGTAWYVNITGMPSSGPITSSSYSISLMNSSYTFTVSTENKTFSPTYTSSFTVNGAPVSITVTFSKVLYKVTFTETGLPAGSTWSVVLNGATNTTTSSTISFMEPNGTYSYSVSTTNPAYGPSVSSSSITVSGSAKTVSLSFVPLTFTVTFTETGLPTGTTWYVNLSNGKSLSSTNSTITVSLTNGTYNYTASSNGYKQKTGSITLNDNSVTVSVVFEKITTVTPAKPTSYLVYVLIGVIVATVVVAAAVLVMMRKK
jgi:hypothetical protein